MVSHVYTLNAAQTEEEVTEEEEVTGGAATPTDLGCNPVPPAGVSR